MTDTEYLLAAFESKAPIQLCKETLSIHLNSRPPVLSDTSGLEWEANKPVSKLHTVYEYWNYDKTALIKSVENKIGQCGGRELRKQFQDLFTHLKSECGIDFFPRRL